MDNHDDPASVALALEVTAEIDRWADGDKQKIARLGDLLFRQKGFVARLRKQPRMTDGTARRIRAVLRGFPGGLVGSDRGLRRWIEQNAPVH